MPTEPGSPPDRALKAHMESIGCTFDPPATIINPPLVVLAMHLDRRRYTAQAQTEFDALINLAEQIGVDLEG